LLVFTLVALPFSVGSSCTVFWSSGTSDEPDRDQEKEDSGLMIVAGQFGNPAVEGLG
ncbi:MAG: hypothetical protein HRT77_14420, partial [Halioglobus sp.]|nr:hypothetical protein [Halioglobus sp.]